MSPDHSLIPDLIRSLAALAFTLGLIVIIAWAYRRYGNGFTLASAKISRLQILEKRNLNTTTTLYLVKHDGHEHLIAVTGNHTSLLHTNNKKPKK